MEEKMIRALGDPTRVKLLGMLAERTLCVRALARQCALSEPAVSQHLKILREAGLVCGTTYGHFTHYRIVQAPLEALHSALGTLLEALAQQHNAPEDCPMFGTVCRKNPTQKEDC